MSEGHEFEERMKVNASTLKNQSDDALKRLIHKMRAETWVSHGLIGRAHKQQRSNFDAMLKPMSIHDPHDRFRRRVVARCLTILSERGIKDV